MRSNRGQSAQRCVGPSKKVHVEVERRFQAHSQDLGGLTMERGFLQRG